jgi:dipeptidyl aminopeptidase/acylaminoacyl peptidase
LRRVIGFSAVLAVLLVAAPPPTAGFVGQSRAAPPPPTAVPAPAPNPDLDQRIGYAGTGHRSLGLVRGEGSEATAAPYFEVGPDHFDDEVSARGSAVTWVSRRDGRTTEVYLRRGSGPTIRVTRNSTDECRPVLSPDGTRIAYSSAAGRDDGGQDIFVVDVDGGRTRRVTDGTGDNTWPTWSPDGATLAFAGRRGADAVPQIYRVPASGGQVTRVTAEATGAAEPAWDPNPAHQRLAYTVGPGGTHPEVWLIAPDGTGRVPMLPSSWQARQPAWTADGTTVAFLSRTMPDGATAGEVDRLYSVVVRDDPCQCVVVLRLAENREVSHPTWYAAPGARTESLLVARTSAPDRTTATLQDIRPDGVDPRHLRQPVLREDPGAIIDSRLLFEPVDGDPWFERQAYSPDGQRIAVSRFETVGGVRTERIWIADADGGRPRLLPIARRGPGDRETDPAWSPDGTRLALSRNSPGGGSGTTRTPSRIEVVEVATGKRLLDLPVPDDLAELDDVQPAWSPDGTRLAFTRGVNRGERLTHIWTANASDGLDQTNLSTTICGSDCAVIDDSAAFSPDGTRLVFNREADGLILVDPEGGGCRLLLPPGGGSCAGPVPDREDGPHQPRDVAWSPDGGRFVFSARRDENNNSPEALWSYDLDDGEIRPLTDHLPGRQKEPTWQRRFDVATAVSAPAPGTTVGGRTSLRLAVTDQGPAPADDIRGRLVVPTGLSVTGLDTPAGTCVLATLRCTLGRIGVGRTVEIRVDLVGTAAGSFELAWSVEASPIDTDASDNRATTTVRVAPAPPGSPADPALTVSVNPRPGYVGGTVTVSYTVRNAGGTTATGLRVRPGLPGGVPVGGALAGCPADGCPVPDLAPGRAATVTGTLSPGAALDTTVRGTATTTGGNANPRNDTATAPLRVVLPRIVAVPPIGPPGFVASIRGVDFPPGVPVRLSWDVGITAAAPPVRPAADGTFAAPLLVLPKDRLGARQVVATGAGFRPATTPFLVVLPAQQPPGLLHRGW